MKVLHRRIRVVRRDRAHVARQSNRVCAHPRARLRGQPADLEDVRALAHGVRRLGLHGVVRPRRIERHLCPCRRDRIDVAVDAHRRCQRQHPRLVTATWARARSVRGRATQRRRPPVRLTATTPSRMQRMSAIRPVFEREIHALYAARAASRERVLAPRPARLVRSRVGQNRPPTMRTWSSIAAADERPTPSSCRNLTQVIVSNPACRV